MNITTLTSIVWFGLTPVPHGDMSVLVKACPAGQITCEAWCKKYRRGSTICLSGDYRSCAANGGPQKCVRDKKPSD